VETHNIKDVFFDLDHTLWDFEKNSALAFEVIFEKHKMVVNLEQFLKYYVPINLKYWEIFRADKITQSELRYGRLREAFNLLDYEIEDDKINLLSEEYIHYLPKFNHLFEGTIQILDYLKPKYELHIITNGFAQIQYNKLNNSKIAHYFKSITNSEMAGVKKPNPIIFQYAIDLAQAKKEHSVMVGDCLQADIQGAIDAGLDAIFFNESHLVVNKNIKQIHHLLELKKYL
jgi:putative hydrolase of the HAD superfamily